MKIGLYALLLATLTAGSSAVSPCTACALRSLKPPKEPPGRYLLHAGPAGLTVEWVAPSIQFRFLGDGTMEVAAPGYVQATSPGQPTLPFTSTLIAIPLGATPRLQILSTVETTHTFHAPLALAPQPSGVERDGAGNPIGGAFAPVERRAVARPPAILEETGVMRGVRLARLAFYPVRREGDTLRVTRRLSVKVSWEAQDRSKSQTRAPSDPLLVQARRVVLNPWDVTPPPRHITEDVSPLDPAQTTAAFIEVASTGVYRVAHEDLDGLGLASMDPNNMRLFRDDAEVAYEWEGDADATFESGEALLFYAEPRFSRWTDVDVYRLVADTTPGQRMTVRDASPTGFSPGDPWVEQLIEENHLYTPDCFCGTLPLGRDGDRWVWDSLSYPDRVAATYPFQLASVSDGRGGVLTLWFIGYTAVAASPDHRLDVALNGTSLGQVGWDGRVAITATFSIPSGVLVNGANTLTLDMPGIPGVSVEGTWLDGFVVHYGRGQEPAGTSVLFETRPMVLDSPSGLPYRICFPLILKAFPSAGQSYAVALTGSGPYRAYDVTDPLSPQRLTGIQVDGNRVTVGDPSSRDSHRIIVVGEDGVLSPQRVRAPHDLWGFSAALDSGVWAARDVTGADLLIITHPDFASALSPLVALRLSQGLTTGVVNVLGIYDICGGRPSPGAIRDFIAEAYASWDPRPGYVLLAGDGSFDPRRYQPEHPPTFIPPYLADVDPWAGEIAADNRYACVDGDDALPDLLLGRLPVDSLAEAQTVVERIVAYETSPATGGWNANVLLVADDMDLAGDFAASSETHAAAYVGAPFTVMRDYCTGISPYLSDCSTQEAEALHADLLTHWNQGALLTQFIGHASWQQWAAERFLHLDDLSSLQNGLRLPVVLQMTCFTSAFQRPEATLDEQLVTSSHGGAVAVWGPTGLGVSTGHGQLSQGFFQAVLENNGETVGEATLAGKLNLAATGQDLDLLDTFTLLGDPALRLNHAVP